MTLSVAASLCVRVRGCIFLSLSLSLSLARSLSFTHTHTHTTAAEKRAQELEEELARTKKAAAEKAAVDAQVVIL